MLPAAFFVWVCAMTGVSCESMPNAAIIQTAYEQEAPSSGVRHDKGLRIVDAMADAWGVDPSRRGKSVWFTLGSSRSAGAGRSRS